MEVMERCLERLDQTLDAAQWTHDSANPESMQATLASMCEALECSFATLWKVDHSAGLLRPTALWHAQNLNFSQLISDTNHRDLSIGEGTAGQVWRRNRAFWSDDLSRDMCLPRSLDAHHAGLKVGIWLPLRAEEKVEGVLEFFATTLPLCFASSGNSGALLQRLENFGVRFAKRIFATGAVCR